MEKCNYCGGELKEVNVSLYHYVPVMVCSSCKKEHVPKLESTTPPRKVEDDDFGIEIDDLDLDDTDLEVEPFFLPKGVGSINCVWNNSSLPDYIMVKHREGFDMRYILGPNQGVGFPPDYAYPSDPMPSHIEVHLYKDEGSNE